MIGIIPGECESATLMAVTQIKFNIFSNSFIDVKSKLKCLNVY